jgi:hypothetical protein
VQLGRVMDSISSFYFLEGRCRAVQAVKVTAQEEGWGHEQMIAGMDEVLASEAVCTTAPAV